MASPESYPLIKIPDEIFSIACDVQRPENKPPKVPAKPIEKILTAPVAPTEPSSSVDNGTVKAILFFGAVGLFLLWLSSSSRHINGFAILGTISLVVGAIILIAAFSNSVSRTEQYARSLNQYQKDKAAHPAKLKEAKKVFDLELSQYETKYQQYVVSKAAYEQQLSDFANPEVVKKYRKDQLFKFFSNAILPSGNADQNKVIKGVTEDCFALALKVAIPQYVLLGTKVNFSSGEGGYYPDLVVYDKKTGLLIDIEIDEPYIGNTGDPIHFIGSNDEKRDAFFNANGWLVIRFYEEQIVTQTEQCILIIKNIIASISSENLSAFPKSPAEAKQRFCQGIADFPKWQKDDVFKMVFRKSRDSYLANEDKQHDLFILARKKLTGKTIALYVAPHFKLSELSLVPFNVQESNRTKAATRRMDAVAAMAKALAATQKQAITPESTVKNTKSTSEVFNVVDLKVEKYVAKKVAVEPSMSVAEAHALLAWLQKGEHISGYTKKVD